jgi:hypothetical protein
LIATRAIFCFKFILSFIAVCFLLYYNKPHTRKGWGFSRGSGLT